MRADARANRERILAAAEEVFGELGAHASTEEVARRAGVGIATVFRHFPTKLDLVEATLVQHFDNLAVRVGSLTSAPDPGEALAHLVSTMIENSRTKIVLANMLSGSGEAPAAALAATRTLHAAVDTVLRRAQLAGAARKDVSVDELYFLVRGLSQAAAAQPVPLVTLRRAIAVVLAGLTSQALSPPPA